MNEQEKQKLSGIMYHSATIRLLSEDKQVLNAVTRIEKLVAELFKQEEASLKA